MEFLKFVSFLIVCFLSTTVGLKCYTCKDNFPNMACDKPSIVICEQHEQFCGKVVLTGNDTYLENCTGNCVSKTCLPKSEGNCKPSEAFHLQSDSKQKGRAGKLYCCQGDLCNSSVKLSHQNKLLYTAVLICTLILNYALN